MTPAARTLKLRLPYPPSVNHYWRHVVISGGARVLLSDEGRKYRTAVYAAVLSQGAKPFRATDRLEVVIQLWVPDMRRRDLDNACKALLDGMGHGGVYTDDSQIDAISIFRRGVVEGGYVEVEITEIEQAQTELFS